MGPLRVRGCQTLALKIRRGKKSLMLHEAGFLLFWFVLGCKIGQIVHKAKKECSEFTLTAKTRGREKVCNYDKEPVFFSLCMCV